jgi:hypothetical protein
VLHKKELKQAAQSLMLRRCSKTSLKLNILKCKIQVRPDEVVSVCDMKFFFGDLKNLGIGGAFVQPLRGWEEEDDANNNGLARCYWSCTAPQFGVADSLGLLRTIGF